VKTVRDFESDRASADKFRSIGVLLSGASLLCGVIAYEKYRSAVTTAAAFSDAIDGVEFQASVPSETWAAGSLCVLLAVAAVRCLVYWYHSNKAEKIKRSLLQ
jgi:hypothetical protein